MRLLLLTTLLLGGCEEQEPHVPGTYTASGPVVAQVNGEPLHQDLIDVLLDRIPEAQRQQMEQTGQLAQLNEQVILTQVLYQAAIEEGLQNDPTVQKSLAFAERSALADALVGKKVDAQITDDKIKAWYTDHLVQFAQPEVKLSHIILQDMAKAGELKTQLDGGADFAALANEHSVDPRTKGTGGKMDSWVPVNQLQGEVGEQLKAAKPGDVVGPFEMGPGTIALLKVDESRAQTPIEEVREQIKAELDKELTNAVIKEYQDKATIIKEGEAAQGATVTPPAPGAPPAGGQ